MLSPGEGGFGTVSHCGERKTKLKDTSSTDSSTESLPEDWRSAGVHVLRTVVEAEVHEFSVIKVNETRTPADESTVEPGVLS